MKIENDTKTLKEYASVEDTLNMHKTASSETTIVSGVPDIIDEKIVMTKPKQRKKTVSILNYEFCQEQVFPYLLPRGKFGYKAPRDIPTAQDFNQYFVSDADYIFLTRYMHE